MTPELLQAISHISRAAGLLASCRFFHDRMEQVSLTGMAASCREAARLCAAAAALLDPKPEAEDEDDPMKAMFQ